jgi:hypothetical protein
VRSSLCLTPAVRTLVAAIIAVAFCARPAFADEHAAVLAEAAFAEGVKLMHADRCAEAIVEFEKSQRLDRASGTALNLAYCQGRLGRIATAWITYRQALTLAEAQGKPEHARIARAEGDKLEPELPRLSLMVPKGEGAPPAIELDSAPLSPEMWTLPIPLDPGEHVVAIVADKARVWQATVMLVRGKQATLELPPVNPPAKVQTAAPLPASPAPQTEASSSDAQGTWAIVTGSVGAACVVTGVALFVSARVQYDGVGDHCRGNVCDDQGYSDRTSAASRAEASYYVLGAGAALLATSAVLWFTRSSSPSAAFLSVDAGRTGFAIGVRGAF